MDATRGLRFSTNPIAYRRILLHFFFIIGAVLIVAGIVITISTLIFLAGAVPTVGQVIDFEKVENAAPFLAASPEDSTLFYPRIEYYDQDNRRKQFVASFGGYRRRVQRGDSIDVLFRSTGRAPARIDHWWYIWGRSIILGGLGLLFAFIGILMPYAFRTSYEKSSTT